MRHRLDQESKRLALIARLDDDRADSRARNCQDADCVVKKVKVELKKAMVGNQSSGVDGMFQLARVAGVRKCVSED